MNTPYILVVDDEPDIRDLIREILRDEGYEVEVAEDGMSARTALRTRRPNLILLDIWMPDTDGISLLKEWVDNQLDVPVLMMSGHGTVETAVEATRLGAYDFIEKPLSTAKLLLTVCRALEADRLTHENKGLGKASPMIGLIGKSRLVSDLRALSTRIAAHDTPVLITGEPGSGKESIAQYIHEQGPKKNGPFMRVAVASLADPHSTLELFGKEEGSVMHFGLLERAGDGTLYLEDIADMGAPIQTRLFGALQHRGFLRVGGSEPVPLNARIIAATSQNLPNQVSQGNFHEELYYLLNVVPLHIPALREHVEDIPVLMEYYIDRLVAQEGLSYRRFSVASQNHLRNHTWPGNIRELQNIVQRLLILGNSPTVELAEVKRALGANEFVPNIGTPLALELPLKEARDLFEKTYLEHQIKKYDGNISQIAHRIGIERTHLYRKLKSLKIDPREITKL